MPERSPRRTPALSDDPAKVDQQAIFLEAEGQTTADAVVSTVLGDERQPDEERGRQRRSWSIGFWLAVAWIAAITVLCALAPYLPFIKDPNLPYAGNFRAGPSLAHPLGGDDIGRDMLARILHGGRISLFISVVVVLLGFFLGGLLGMIAGYYRGRLDSVIVAAMDIMLAFPALILALALVAFIGQGKPSLRSVIIALSVLSIAPLGRITRATTLQYSQREFVLAARTLGASNARVIRKEILPNVIPPMASFALVVIAIIIVVEGGLSFLGVSVSSPQATWGNMIVQGTSGRLLKESPHIALIPAAVMFFTILALNFVGDSLRARFDVKEGAL